MHIIDLTHIMQTGMSVYPGDEEVNVRRTRFINRDGWAQTAFSTGSHAGTHVDTPAHFYTEAPTLDALGPDNFIGWGVVVDCTNLDGNVIDQLQLAGLAEIDNLDFALLRTGWEQHWKTDRYYADFPALTETAARFLGGLDLKGIGLDTPSPDPVDSRDFPVHHILFDHGMVCVENLCNLDELPEQDFIFSCQPLRIRDGEGCPVRAVGMTF